MENADDTGLPERSELKSNGAMNVIQGWVPLARIRHEAGERCHGEW